MRRMLLAAGVLAVSLAARGAEGSEPLPPGDHARAFASSRDGTEQPFRFFVPQTADGSAPLPLVVVLHGKGVDQNAWFDLTPAKEFAEKHDFVVAAPHGRGNFWYRGAAEQDVLDVVEEAKRLAPIDPDRIHLIGHSMGGWGTWWIATRQPDMFATACPMSGFAPRDMLASARHLDPFAIHDAGDPIVPAEFSREPIAKLVASGIGARYREEHGYGHGSKMIGDNFDRIFGWLADHRRVERPDRVSFAVRTPAKGRAWWMRVLATERFPSTGTIDAEIGKDGSVAVATDRIAAFAIRPAEMPLEAADARLALVVDGAPLGEFAVAESPWIVASKIDDAWRAVATAELPARTETAVECPDAERLAAATQDEFVAILGNVLREETGAEAALFDRFDLNWQGAPVTLDGIADTWGYAVESLAVYAFTGAELAAFAQREPLGLLVVLPEGETLDPARTYRTLASTRPIQGMPPDPLETVPLRPDEILVGRTLRTGRFP